MDQITIISEKEDILVCDFKAPVDRANRLRRALIAKIPCMAIDSVKFIRNTSVLDSEFIASRLSLIPLKIDAQEFKDGEKVVLTLDVRAVSPGITYVYSSDIKGDYVPVHSNIPILKLIQGQEVIAKMEARKGYGSEHAKWITTCPVGFAPQESGVFRLTIESTGSYTARQLLEMGLELIDE